MQQYRDIKARHQHAILFFRMGDFYEMFFEDAETAARVLGLTLTSRNNGGAAEVPLAGVPVKAAGEYVRRLVQQGFRVAICEQMEDPRLAKGIVKREVIETITPGAAFSDDLLDGTRNNFLCAVRVDGQQLGVAAVDLSTGVPPGARPSRRRQRGAQPPDAARGAGGGRRRGVAGRPGRARRAADGARRMGVRRGAGQRCAGAALQGAIARGLRRGRRRCGGAGRRGSAAALPARTAARRRAAPRAPDARTARAARCRWTR